MSDNAVPAVDEPILHHQFDDVGQQHTASVLCMWAFLATEVLFFGALFASYFAYRLGYPQEFAQAGHRLLWKVGALNTVWLLASSLCMAMAVRASQLGRRAASVRFMIATVALGGAFLVTKTYEYYIDYEEHLVPGPAFVRHFEWEEGKTTAVERLRPEYSAPDLYPSPGGSLDATAPDARVGLAPYGEELTAPYLKPLPLDKRKAELFFVFYYFMTGLHAFHVIVGMVLIGIIAWLTQRGWASGNGVTHIDVAGLYWHFVDVVWIFLYPVLYLLDVRA